MFEYKIENLGDKTDRLVVFLHGYNGCIEDHSYALDWMKKYIKNAKLVVPLAPETCDKNPNKRQWFGMIKNDPENSRFSESISAGEIFNIYNRTQDKISQTAAEINDFILKIRQKYGIAAEKTYIIGFSQGAMLAIYCALTNKQTFGGAFSISGLIAGEKKLAGEICSLPPVYLFHGKDDLKVQYKTLPLTEKWLQKHGIRPYVVSYPHLAHKICEEEIIKISEILK